MSDDTTKFEQHKSQLVAGLTVVAESMRKCADMAEAFAGLVNGGAISPDSPAARMVRDLVVSAKADAAAHADDKATVKRKRKGDVTEDGEEPKRRKRKPKDPNAPKRPASSYILFQNEVRKEIKASHPNVSNNELLGIIAKQWQEMSDEDKAVYTQAMASAKERYSQDKKAYDSRTPEEIEAANAAAAVAKKSRKGAKAAAATEAKHVSPVDKPAASGTSPSTDSSEGSASEESDEEGHADHDNEQDSSSSDDDERLVAAKRPSKPAVTRVTPAVKERKKKTHA
ncbi:hypothetical protein AX17_006040 [Amanita inopinata Kibby_2008]|nr:hypothetical protein AX17_006040 [Amanita inopinata Kibby_2008]